VNIVMDFGPYNYFWMDVGVFQVDTTIWPTHSYLELNCVFDLCYLYN